jgi:hypothetical protein
MFEDVLNLNVWLEWSGALIGVMGAGLLATHSRVAKFGWLFFLTANLLFIAWALRIGALGLLVQQICFTFTSLLGIARGGLFSSNLGAMTPPPSQGRAESSPDVLTEKV